MSRLDPQTPAEWRAAIVAHVEDRRGGRVTCGAYGLRGGAVCAWVKAGAWSLTARGTDESTALRALAAALVRSDEWSGNAEPLAP